MTWIEYVKNRKKCPFNTCLKAWAYYFIFSILIFFMIFHDSLCNMLLLGHRVSSPYNLSHNTHPSWAVIHQCLNIPTIWAGCQLPLQTIYCALYFCQKLAVHGNSEICAGQKPYIYIYDIYVPFKTHQGKFRSHLQTYLVRLGSWLINCHSVS